MSEMRTEFNLSKLRGRIVEVFGTQEKLAELCDVSRNTVVSWESGQKAPKTSAVFRLAAALCI